MVELVVGGLFVVLEIDFEHFVVVAVAVVGRRVSVAAEVVVVGTVAIVPVAAVVAKFADVGVVVAAAVVVVDAVVAVAEFAVHVAGMSSVAVDVVVGLIVGCVDFAKLGHTLAAVAAVDIAALVSVAAETTEMPVHPQSIPTRLLRLSPLHYH
jgi:hypothetical protein